MIIFSLQSSTLASDVNYFPTEDRLIPCMLLSFSKAARKIVAAEGMIMPFSFKYLSLIQRTEGSMFSYRRK